VVDKKFTGINGSNLRGFKNLAGFTYTVEFVAMNLADENIVYYF
jgi:hypothetical protein